MRDSWIICFWSFRFRFPEVFPTWHVIISWRLAQSVLWQSVTSEMFQATLIHSFERAGKLARVHVSNIRATYEYTRLNMVICRLCTNTLVTCEVIGAIKIKCTIFVALRFISTCARDMPCIHKQENASYTRVSTTLMRHRGVPHKTRVQSKVHLQGETLSVHEDVEPIGIRHKPRNINFS